MSAADTLKNLAILRDWTLEERLMLAAQMTPLDVAPGTVLLSEGDQADAAYILEHGRLRILSRGEIVGVVDTVACFGEISCLLPDTPVTATVRAESQSLVYRISRDDLLATVQRVPKLWRSLFAQVSERLKRANKRLAEILEHSPQGFLKLDREARITNEYSAKCVDYLGENPLSGRRLPELLNPGDPAGVASWQSVFSMVFEDVGVPLSDLFDLLTPEARLESDGLVRDLRLQFHAIHDDTGRVSAVDVGIEDVSRERELERAGAIERGRQVTLGKIYQNPDSFFSLLRLIDDVERTAAERLPDLARGPLEGRPADPAGLLRDLHSLKGFAGNFGLSALRHAAHDLETAIAHATAGPPGPAALPVAAGQLERAQQRLLDAITEGRALRAMIDPSLLQRLEGVVLAPLHLEGLRAALAAGDCAAAAALLLAAESVDVRQLFACWPAEIEQRAASLGKQVRFDLFGTGGRIPKPVFMGLDRVLVHILNNALDHGFEDPETRLCADKDPQGTLSVMAEVGSGQLMLEIADDGAGRDFRLALEQARQLPSLDPALVERCAASGEPWRVLLLPGFTSADSVSVSSGRGVGLDAVAVAVTALGGQLALDSSPGQGFALRIVVPLVCATDAEQAQLPKMP